MEALKRPKSELVPIGDVVPAAEVEDPGPPSLESVVDRDERHRVAREQLRRQLEREQTIAAQQRMLDAIPRRFHGARLATYRPKTPSQGTALDAVRRWLSEQKAGRAPMLALVGDTGTGKSHLLYGAAWQLFEDGGLVPYCVPWYNFSNDVRWGRAETPSHVVRRQWHAARPCLIDEARSTSSSDFDALELMRYSFHAYDEEIPVLLTTNMDSLDVVMGRPAADRFSVVVIDGESAR